MIRTYQLKGAFGVLALALASQACTVVKGDGADDETEMTDEDGTDTEESDAEESDAEETEMEESDEGSDAEESDPEEATDMEATDAEESDAEEPDPEETDEEVDPGESDAGAPEPEPEGEETDGEETDGEEPEPEPEGERSDEFTGEAPAFDCGERATGLEPTELNIDEDTTWSGTIFVDGELRLRDAELVIEPGTKVILGADSRVVFGYLGAASTLRANGTEEEPIVFCGETDEAGYWRGIVVDDNVVGVSNFSNILIDGAGGDEPSLALSADILVENVVVRNGADVGLRAADFNPDSTGLFVTGHEDVGVELTSDSGVNNFPVGGNLTGNGRDAVLLDFVDVNDDTTFRDLRVPYAYERNELRIRDGATVVMEAGSEFVMGADSRIEVGYLGGDATLQVMGAPGNPVVMRGDADDNGFWEGVRIQGNVRSDSLVEYLAIDGAGGNNANALLVESPIRISDLTVTNSGRGVRIGPDGLDEDSSGWSITGTEGEPLELEVNAWPTLPRDSTFAGNEGDRALVTGSNFDTDGTIPALDVPYLVDSEVRFRDGIESTIEPGANFIMRADTRFVVGYLGGDATLIAEGTEEAPITFVGLDPEPGYWDAIVVENDANSATSFSFVEISHAGQRQAALFLRRSVSVENCTFTENDSAGIAKLADDDNDYAGSNTFADNGGDDVVDL